MTQSSIDALVLHRGDNVATALRAITAGETIHLGTPDGPTRLPAVEAIPLCHKLALGSIAAGTPITKYGEPIGEATTAIGPGAHVHAHNLRSRRGRAG